MDYQLEYQKTLKWRVLFWSILLPILMIIVLAIILFAYGYRYDLKEKKLYLTSVLYVDSFPDGAKMYLDNKFQGQTKLIIKGVKPGSYKIKLEKEEFAPWEAEIEIPPYSLVEINPSLFYQKIKSENTLDYDHFLDFKDNNLLFSQGEKIFLKNLENVQSKPIPLNLENSNFSQAFLGEKGVSVFDFGAFWEIIDQNNTSSKIKKPKDNLRKTIFVDRTLYALNDKKELLVLDENGKHKEAEKVLDIHWQAEKIVLITQDNQLIYKGITLAQNKSGGLKILNDSLEPVPISSLKFCPFNLSTLCLYNNNGYFILEDNGLYWLGNNLQDIIEQNDQIAWLDNEGSIYIYSKKEKTTKFVNRYFDLPQKIYFLSPNYLALKFKKSVKILETQTKQEFPILQNKETPPFISFFSTKYMALINGNQTTILKITEAQSFWEKILQTFRK